tara:strand:- start:4260 stop:4637 length:378 start_codon:yes stop_codon:yes gene_type:complete
MNTFQKTVLTISVIVLIFSLIILGIFLAKSLLEDSYPPVISDCPDYWDVTYNVNDEVVCRNTSTINKGKGDAPGGECNDYPVNIFLASGSQNEDILCEKYKWSKKCDITWDGVTNNNKACDLGYY